MSILAIENLHKSFGEAVALRGINIELGSPGVYGFLGPNGAGKTTTFKLVCALLRPTAGRVLIDGIDVQKDPRKALMQVGVQFDSPAFYPYLTGRENLRVLSTWAGIDVAGRVQNALSLVDLHSAADKKVGAYSWGMKQRLGLASALLFDPTLVLLDEPTNGLDPGGIAAVRRVLPRLAREEGRTILLSSHRMDEVEQVCDHVIIIHEGAIIASGTMDELASEKIRIEIRCPDPGHAISVLSGIEGIHGISRAGKSRIILFASANVASEIPRMLVERAVNVEEVIKKRETLEDIFFRVTGTGNDEA